MFKVWFDSPLDKVEHKLTMILGGITAAMPGGSWLGALVSGYLSDILGRKKAIQIGSVIW